MINPRPPTRAEAATDLDAPDNTAAKVSFLLRRAFPEPPEAIETHLSWVFLTEDRAYKLKKPVRNPFLDHRSIDERQADCEREVALNSALAPGVYLGVLPLTRTGPGELALGGEGQAIDWLVVMRRLPADSFLDHRLRTSAETLTADEAHAIVDHLASFYGSTRRRPLNDSAYRRRLAAALAEDQRELLCHDHALEHELVIDLTNRLDEAVADPARLVGRSSRLLDGHGDLRPEHVVAAPQPLVIDRITFNDEMYRIDPAADLALFAVECRLLGRGALGDQLTASVLERMSDDVCIADRALYRALRAVTRARLSIAHLDDGDHDAGRWLDRTDAYLAVAAGELRWIDEPEDAAPSGVQVQEVGE